MAYAEFLNDLYRSQEKGERINLKNNRINHFLNYRFPYTETNTIFHIGKNAINKSEQHSLFIISDVMVISCFYQGKI